MNKQWLALILCAGLTLGQYPVSGAQKEPAEQTETAGQSAENNEETSVPAETQTYQDAEESTEEGETEDPEKQKKVIFPMKCFRGSVKLQPVKIWLRILRQQ